MVATLTRMFQSPLFLHPKCMQHKSGANNKNDGKGGGLGSPLFGGAADNIIPNKGWKLVNYGQSPVPKFSLVGGCLEDA